jgi:signal transduction histidine kinase
MRAIEILLVEDSPTDRLIAVEALRQSKLINSLNVVENGVDAMAYLRREGKFSAARRPDIILLDLNLPKKDGREVLAEVKADPLLKLIPVIVLTTSESDEDMLRAYGDHANSYITKPVDLQRFTEALRTLGGYWFQVVTLPPEAALERLSRAEPPRPVPPDVFEDTVRVLLIEDSPTDALFFREALAASGLIKFELSHVLRLADAQDQLHAQRYDLVMIDLGLPDSQGLDTYRRVRGFAGGLPLVVLTGLDDDFTGMQALREGAHDYLVKGQLTPRALARAARYAIEKKQHQEQLRQAQKLEAVGRLAAGVAHDFNNILSIVRGNAETLRDAGEQGDTQEAVQEILDASDRAAALARQLLTFSRQRSVQMRALDLNRVLGDFTGMLRRVVTDIVPLELQLATKLPAVLADTGMLEQVLLNLAVNARDAMPGGGQLRLQTDAVDITSASARLHPDAYAGRFARLTVSDTGSGMTPEVLARVFEPFFTTKELGRGTGLGLATVHGIVQDHRGWIEVTSRVGAGTSFEVFLPATGEEPIARAETPNAKAQGGSETILVVEDETVLLKIATRILERNGYTVLPAGSVAEALTLWREHAHRIDLLFTDLVLPEAQTGRQLAEHLLKETPSLKVIFTSGYSPDFLDASFELVEGVNFLNKPYPLSRLLLAVRHRLDEASAPSAAGQ